MRLKAASNISSTLASRNPSNFDPSQTSRRIFFSRAFLSLRSQSLPTENCDTSFYPFMNTMLCKQISSDSRENIRMRFITRDISHVQRDAHCHPYDSYTHSLLTDSPPGSKLWNITSRYERNIFFDTITDILTSPTLILSDGW